MLDFWDFWEAVQADALMCHGILDKRMRIVSTAILFCIYALSTCQQGILHVCNVGSLHTPVHSSA